MLAKQQQQAAGLLRRILLITAMVQLLDVALSRLQAQQFS
jgi:hypothetical protein